MGSADHPEMQGHVETEQRVSAMRCSTHQYTQSHWDGQWQVSTGCSGPPLWLQLGPADHEHFSFNSFLVFFAPDHDKLALSRFPANLYGNAHTPGRHGYGKSSPGREQALSGSFQVSFSKHIYFLFLL